MPSFFFVGRENSKDGLDNNQGLFSAACGYAGCDSQHDGQGGGFEGVGEKGFTCTERPSLGLRGGPHIGAMGVKERQDNCTGFTTTQG
jgi:hypothetical protein